MPEPPPGLGPVFIDLAGTEIQPEEAERLRHPRTGGVILFARNYRSVEQLCALTRELRALRKPELLIAVDHEGGRVQRFRDGFTRIPPMRRLGSAWETDRAGACAAARSLAYVMAGELRACGVDFSFAPVLDLDYGTSSVIGDRALHSNPQAVIELAGALIAGLHAAGMASVGKHFPGHGYVRADSHHDLPVDDRSYAQIQAMDLLPYAALARDALDAVMPAHVIYAQIDPNAAGFSAYWLQRELRGRLGFDGVICSDDLSMQGARAAGDALARARAALAAGCDLVLVCNAPGAAQAVLAGLDAGQPDPGRIARLRGRGWEGGPAALATEPKYREALETATRFCGEAA